MFTGTIKISKVIKFWVIILFIIPETKIINYFLTVLCYNLLTILKYDPSKQILI